MTELPFSAIKEGNQAQRMYIPAEHPYFTNMVGKRIPLVQMWPVAIPKAKKSAPLLPPKVDAPAKPTGVFVNISGIPPAVALEKPLLDKQRADHIWNALRSVL